MIQNWKKAFCNGKLLFSFINIDQVFFMVFFVNFVFFFNVYKTFVWDDLFTTWLETAYIAFQKQHLAFIVLRPLVYVDVCSFCILYLLRLLLILCLIYIKMPLFHIIYIHIAKMTVSFTFVVIDYIISNCWMSIVIVLLKCIFRPFRYPYILRPTFYLI